MTKPTPDLVTFDQLKGQQWFATVDNLVGGACVTNVDKPAAEIDTAAGERAMAWGVWPEFARYVAALHNAHRQAIAEMAKGAREIDPDDYDQDSREGRYDLAFDEGHAVGAALAVRPIVALIYEACINAVGVIESAPEIDHAAHLATILAGLGAAVEPLNTHQLPADLEGTIHDATESIGWWEMAAFIAKRPAMAYQFLAEYAPELLVVEGDG